MNEADAGASTAADAPAPLRIDVRRGHPSAEEVAAVIAVVSEAYRQETAAAVADDAPRSSGWQIAARGLRRPFERDLGWGRFG